MKATRTWGDCACGCGKKISSGTEMRIIDGEFFIAGHEVKKTRTMQTIKKQRSRGAKPSTSKVQLDLFDGE